MMSDKHIGYSMWSMPKENKYPELVMVKPLSKASMGIAIEGCENAWPGNERAVLPVFDRLLKPSYYIDIFNKGTGFFSFTATPDMGWIKLSETEGSVATERRIQVELDWNSMSIGTAKGKITIKSGRDSVTVGVEAINARLPVITEPYFGNFSGSEFSIPAPLFNRNVPGSKARWVLLPDLGRAEGNMGIYPVTAPSVKASEAPYLEYKVFINNTGKVRICLGILPTQDINPARGLRIAAGLNDQQAIVLDARKGFADTFSEYTPENLSRSKTLKAIQPANPGIKLISNGPRRNEIFDNLRWLDFELNVERAGLQNLRIYMVDPEIVLEQIVVNPDNRFPSYFGAPVMQHIPGKELD
ncbi:hypothetical protein [Pedobacter sp. P26]|uniref:hypothetical protein n=1 Tax=Pedobacter sp. P26 TaxID=3423956 RepID=UPI003D675A9A